MESNKNNISIQEFVALQRKLLELELKSEEDEERTIASSVVATNKKASANNDNNDEVPSHVLRNLETSDISVGLFGRTVVSLVSIGGGSGSSLLPSHRFTVGDEIEIYSKHKAHKTGSNSSSNVGGVICAMTDTCISIALFSSSKKKNQSNKNSNNKKKAKDNNDDDDDDDDNDVLGEPPLSIIPKSSIEVHKKLLKSLSNLEKYGIDHPIAANIINFLFGDNNNTPISSSNTQPPPKKKTEIVPFNNNLDDSQLEAISFALNNTNDGPKPVSLIHGPPGTGKTTTVAELIRQAVHVHNMKVLVTAPSNVAVDNILERLVESSSNNNKTSKSTAAKSTKARRDANKNKNKNNKNSQKIKAVRLGHPARIKSSILPYSLESLVQNADGQDIVSDVRDELQSFLRILSNPKSRGSDKRTAYREVKTLRKELKTREEKVVQTLMNTCQVVLATNVGADNRLLDKYSEDNGFDLVIIDECAQALEASCWIPILRGKRLVLAGDHCQLPPTIKNKSVEVQRGLGKTLFERIMNCGESEVSRMLRVQYRMHEDIANWASNVMYNGELQTNDNVRKRTLSQLPNVIKQQESSSSSEASGRGEDDDDDVTNTTLLLIDTVGCDMNESVSASGSRYNDGEAEIVALHVRHLLEVGLKPEEIAVISPYNGQVELLRSMLLPDIPKLEIRSVDGFQGGEREAVVLSLVRSSDNRRGRGGNAGIGFLKDNRRLNVAVTRAKRHFALICDTETVCQSDFIKNLTSWMEEKGEHRTALDYLSTPTATTTADNINNDFFEKDLQDVEAQIGIHQKTNINDGKANSSSEDKKKPPAAHEQQQRRSIKEGEDRRKAILDKISSFAETGSRGDELALSSELSKFDRKVVHEFATELGLGHRSEGIDGVDRRIIVSIEKDIRMAKAVNEEEQKGRDEEKVQDVLTGDSSATKVAAFAALVDSDGDDDSSVEDIDNNNAEEKKLELAEAIPPRNSLLKSLAEERMKRQQHLNNHDENKPQQQATATKKSKKKKKSKGKKLGGGKAEAKKANEMKDGDVVNSSNGIDDDMAFLDAQIEKVQTSHGRKVEGAGKGYKSIVNGILLAKPPPKEKKKNANVDK